MIIYVLIQMDGVTEENYGTFQNSYCFSSEEKVKDYLENRAGDSGKVFARVFWFGQDNTEYDQAWKDSDQVAIATGIRYDVREVEVDNEYQYPDNT